MTVIKDLCCDLFQCVSMTQIFRVVRMCADSNIIFLHILGNIKMNEEDVLVSFTGILQSFYSGAVICQTINSAESAKTAHSSRVSRQNVTRVDSFKGTNMYNCNAETGCSFQKDRSWMH